MTTAVRHLVLGSAVEDLAEGLIATACPVTDGPVPYDRTRHTYLTAATTCTDCLAVHAAWHTVFVASLG